MNEPSKIREIVSNMAERDRTDAAKTSDSADWRTRMPVNYKLKDAPIMYDTSKIYDDPAEHMTVRGMFQYVGIDIIEV